MDTRHIHNTHSDIESQVGSYIGWGDQEIYFLLKRGLLSWLLHTKGKFSEYQLTRKETLPTFRLDALVFFRAKVKLDANTCYLLAAHIKNPSKHVTGCPGKSGVVLNQPRPAIFSGSPSSSRGAPALRHG